MDFAVVDPARYGVPAADEGTRSSAREDLEGLDLAGGREGASIAARAARRGGLGAAGRARSCRGAWCSCTRRTARRSGVLADLDEGRQARRRAVARPPSERVDRRRPRDARARAPTRSAGSSTPRARRGRRRGTRCRTCARSRRSSRSSCATSTRSSPSTRTSTASTRRAERAAAGPSDCRSSTAGCARELALTARDVTARMDAYDVYGGDAAPRRLRRRPLELVGAPQPRALLAERLGRRQAQRLRDPLRVPGHARQAHRAVHAVRGRGDVPEPRRAARARPGRRESVHLEDWPEADGPRPSTSALSRKMRRGPRARQRRAAGADGGQDQGAPAASRRPRHRERRARTASSCPVPVTDPRGAERPATSSCGRPRIGAGSAGDA